MPEGLFRRRRLPHLDVEDGTYFITTCLDGSIPARGLAELLRYRDQLDNQRRPNGLTELEWEVRKHKLVFARFDRLIDDEPVVRHLERHDLAKEVQKSLYHFAGQRYDLIGYVVMPSHFHWVFHPRREWFEVAQARGHRRTPRERIMQSVKGYTAFICNRLLGLAGTFWQDEAYDHVVRGDDELARIIEYIEANPVRAGLSPTPEDWRFSSARDRKLQDIPFGQPLLRLTTAD
jgi:putative transposase